MALSVTNIFNMAISQLGIGKQINQGDGSTEAKVCALWYDVVRQDILCDYPWAFAKLTVDLSQTANTPPTNWGYQYTIPSDCLRFLRIITAGTDTPRNDQRIPYESAAAVNADGSTTNVLNCNSDTVTLEYVQDVTDLSRWGPDALIALSLQLAARIGMALTVKPDLVKAVADAAKEATLAAAADSMSEGFEGPAPDSEFIAVRQLGWPLANPGSYGWSAYPGGFSVE